MALFTRRARTPGRARRDLRDAANVAGRRIRAHLDGDAILTAVVEEVHAILAADRTTFWLTTGYEEPKLARAAGGLDGAGAGADPPRAVLAAARRQRSSESDGALAGRQAIAVPVIAPRGGVLGAICVEADATGDDVRAFLTEIATETGFALETANLYASAVEGKEKSEAILSRVGEAIVVTDAAGTILQWNQAAEGVFDTPATRAVGRPCAALLGLRDGERQLSCDQGCALLASDEGDAVIGREVTRTRHDGRRQPLLASVATVVDADGSVFEIVHSLRDITRLKEADEAKTLFLATASHELKTPLTVIQGFAQLLSSSRTATDGQREQALDAIERRARQLNRIVERLLLSSRIEAGRAEVRVRELDLAPLLREQTRSTAAATGREVTLDLPGELPVALADDDGVVTVLEHLIDNAAKYSPAGGPIEVTAWAEGGSVCLSVSDHGIGMDAQQAARCFDRFWQAESSDVRRFGGTGIGLYIVRSLVEAMGGRVDVESAPQKGSTFTVRLPRSAPEPGVPAETVPEPSVGREPSQIREFMRQMGIPSRS